MTRDSFQNRSWEKMKIGIIGTRGIPNRYGGFEQFAEYLSAGLAKKGHEVFVYNSDQHPHQEKKLGLVHIIGCKDPERWMGTTGQFFYDLNCIRDAQKRNYEVLLHLGYTSDSIWWRRWPKQAVHLVNMDGFEWKRMKFGIVTRRFLKRAESWAAKHADILVSDSTAMQEYLLSRYGKRSTYIPYGATVFKDTDPSKLNGFHIQPGSYFLLIARMEPENNIEMIIKGWRASVPGFPLLIVGNKSNRYGKFLEKRYRDPQIRFMGTIYDLSIINNLRYYSALYFHGHSVGGTNPSLLEAMACGCRIAAHDNVFNRAVLENNANFFSSEKDIIEILEAAADKEEAKRWQEANWQKIQSVYNWQKIIDQYEELMLAAAGTRL